MHAKANAEGAKRLLEVSPPALYSEVRVFRTAVMSYLKKRLKSQSLG